MSPVTPGFPDPVLRRLAESAGFAAGREACFAALRDACSARMDPGLNRDISRWESVLARLAGLVEKGEVRTACPWLETVTVQGSDRAAGAETARAVGLGLPGGVDGHEHTGAVAPDSTGRSTAGSVSVVEGLARELTPWRKGPFLLAGCLVDTEWRSDLKWDRLKDRISPLGGRRVLDVGCGSGYHLWRMVLGGAGLALGIEPYHLSVMQFRFASLLGSSDKALVLPFTLEDWHRLAGQYGLAPFDTVFSMGVLYHRRDHLAHLRQLGDLLAPGGELVLETLVLKDGARQVLSPPGRYAAMSNVHAIPGLEVLTGWMAEAGYQDVEVIHQGATSMSEQRATSWMTFNSLMDSLDPSDPERTVEGHPAPYRAVLRAKKR